MATAMNELTERPNIGSGARQEMEEWMRHLDTDAPRISQFQFNWEQQQLVLSHIGSGWAAEISDWRR
jgi:hypothetical protein